MRPLLARLRSSIGPLVFAVAFFLVLVEGGLRLTAPWHGPTLSNALRSSQGSFPGGMYVRLPESDLRFQRPGLAVENYWNGYRWHHRTDSRGFRNPPDTSTAVLLLGDSLIYGHGVEEAETVAGFLRRRHHLGAYNMARQGDCLYQSYVLFRLFATELAPRRVILFPFVNDVWDLHLYRSEEQLSVAPEIGLSEARYRNLRQRLDGLGEPSRIGRLLFRLGTVRLAYGLGRKLQRLRTPAASRIARFETGVDDSAVPFVQAVLDDPALARAIGYYRRVLADLERRCARDDVRLEIVFLDLPWGGETGDRAQVRFTERLRDVADELGIPFASSRGLFDACPDCVLPGDGHLSPRGNRLLADFVAELPAS